MQMPNVKSLKAVFSKFQPETLPIQLTFPSLEECDLSRYVPKTSR
jgi:hypothetical protein